MWKRVAAGDAVDTQPVAEGVGAGGQDGVEGPRTVEVSSIGGACRADLLTLVHDGGQPGQRGGGATADFGRAVSCWPSSVSLTVVGG